MSGRMYVWSKFHKKTTLAEHIRLRLENEYIQLSAAVGITAIVLICMFEVIFENFL